MLSRQYYLDYLLTLLPPVKNRISFTNALRRKVFNPFAKWKRAILLVVPERLIVFDSEAPIARIMNYIDDIIESNDQLMINYQMILYY